MPKKRFGLTLFNESHRDALDGMDWCENRRNQKKLKIAWKRQINKISEEESD
jgi:hypothetical protein